MSEVPRGWRPDAPPPPPLIELLPAPGDVYAAVPPRAERPRYLRAFALFALTFFTTTTLGPITVQFSRTDMTTDLVTEVGVVLTPRVIHAVWGNPEMLRMGLSFSIPALLILLAHELGHYIACRRYRLPSTLPYFLPLPVGFFGTFGAFIRIKAAIHSKRQLFDVGIAGPIAGFVTLIPFLLYGIAHSVPAAVAPPTPGSELSALLVPGHCLAIELAARWFHGPLGEGMVLNLHPMALAAWLGLFATALNLLPLGQLDGGHILYAAIGRGQRRLALPLWLALGVMGFYWPGWWLWCVIVLVIGLFHPPVYDESIPLDRRRRWLALLALAIFALAFIPNPIDILAIG